MAVSSIIRLSSYQLGSRVKSWLEGAFSSDFEVVDESALMVSHCIGNLNHRQCYERARNTTGKPRISLKDNQTSGRRHDKWVQRRKPRLRAV